MKAVINSEVGINIVPVDILVKGIIYIILEPIQKSGIVYHMVNNVSLSYKQLGLWMISAGYDITLLSYKEWRELLVNNLKENALKQLITYFPENNLLELGQFSTLHTTTALGTTLCNQLMRN